MRRIVLGFLVLLSLTLMTISFRGPESGPLHDAQNVGAAVMRPFQVAVERVVRPFRDAWGWFDDLLDAKAENEALRRQNEQLLQRVIQSQSALQDNAELRGLLDYRASAAYPAAFESVAAAVIEHETDFQQRIVIDAGTDDGVELFNPVVTGSGLVGRVTNVSGGTAQVTLLTDGESWVSAEDSQSGARGLIRHARAGSDALVFDRVGKSFVVAEGDEIVTAGTQRGEHPSIFPRGIPIGRVTSVGQTDVDLYKQIQVEPYVDFDSLDSVLVLVPREGREGG
jgi:rod shape-determining protein MreC